MSIRKNLPIRIILASVFVLIVSLMILFAGAGLSSEKGYADATYATTIDWSRCEVQAFRFSATSSSDKISFYTNPSTGLTEECNIVQMDMTDNWVKSFLAKGKDNNGNSTSLFLTALQLVATYGEEVVTVKLDNSKLNTALTLPEYDGYAYFPVYAATDTDVHQKPYAVLDSCSVSGTDYAGTTYTNADIYSIQKAGVYHLAENDGLSDMTLRFYVDYNSYEETKEVEEGVNNTYTLAAGTIDGDNVGSFPAKTAPDLGMEYGVLARAKLTINDSISMITLSGTYDGTTDFRDRVVLHSTSQEQGVFYFSTQENNDYNVSDSDIRRFLPFSGAPGLGTITAQTQNIQPGANTSATNLMGLTDVLKIVWYEKTLVGDTVMYNVIDDDTPILSAGDYIVKIECDLSFYGQTPIYVSYNGAEYSHPFTVNKRSLIVSVNDPNILNITKSKEYDGTVSASSLFKNVTITASYWTNEMGGSAADYSSLSSYLTADNSGAGLFIFGNSRFDNSSIGTGKTVYIDIAFRSISNDFSAEQALKQYAIVPVDQYGDPIDKNSGNGMYEVGNDFSITANQLKLELKPKLESESSAFNVITYGDYSSVRDLSVAEHAVVSNTVVNNNVIQPQYWTTDWRILIVKGTLGNTVESSTYNTIYVSVQLGKMLDPSDTESICQFTDSEGNRYAVPTDTTIYAGTYYFIYQINVVYKNTTSTANTSVPTADCNGSVQIRNNTNVVLFELDIGDVLNLSVQKKEVRFSATVTNEKYYDGTSAISGFTWDQEGILITDEEYLQPRATAQFGRRGVGEDIPIVYNFYLEKRTGVAEDVFAPIAASYELNTADIAVTTGTIKPLDLTVEFAASSYERKFDTLTYVAILVSEGETADEDLYYYYLFTEEGGSRSNGFATLETIENMSAFEPGSLIIKLKISGFLTGEGFAYPGNDVSDFMLKKESNNPGSDYAEPLDAYSLLSWRDTSGATPVALSRLTDSSASHNAEDLYRLELFVNEEEALDSWTRYRTVSNYRLVPKANDYGTLFIDKLNVNPSNIVIAADNSNNRLEYYGGSNAAYLFSKGKISYSNHREVDQVNVLCENTPQNMLTIEEFHSSDAVSHAIAQNLINEFVVAGTYTLILHIPETRNYNAYTTDPFDVVVNRKNVDVYVTFPWMEYGGTVPSYDSQDFRIIDDIDDHVLKVDINRNIVSPDADGYEVYVYGKDLLSGNLILYSGFVNSEEIGDDENDVLASVSISLALDVTGKYPAGIHNNPNPVIASGAIKNNYDFRYISSAFYIKKRPLTIEVTGPQTKDYTGNQIYPDYTIDGPGALAMYVVEYNGVPVLDQYGNEDETQTDVIRSGIYKVKVYAKPDATQGASSNNYQASTTREELVLTVLPTRLTILNDMLADEMVYTGNAYVLKAFNDYCQGVSSSETSITAKYDWGTVALKSFTSNITPAPAEINEVGEYDLVLTATIIEGYRNDVYFTDDGTSSGTHVYTVDFVVHLEITKTSAFNFTVVPAAGQNILLVSEKTYTKVYDGQEAYFNYTLTTLGNNSLNVITAIDGVLYAKNGVVFDEDVPEDVTAAAGISAKIAGVVYDITGRNKLLNVKQGVSQEYTVTFYINDASSENYNSNFTSLTYVCSFTVLERPLYVFIDFDEEDFNGNFVPSKVYRGLNADVEALGTMIYDGWVAGQSASDFPAMVAPVIDWSNVAADDEAPVGSYNISATGGTAPTNYVYDYSLSQREFRILRARASLLVYGFYDSSAGEYTDYTVYNGLSLETELNSATLSPKVQVKRMFGLEEIDDPEDDIGSDGISIAYVGRFIGNDKENVTELDFIPKQDGEVCKDVGEYVFAISAVASANYEAVQEAYYYLKIVKADLTASFVKLNDLSEIVTYQGNATKVYDRTTTYPTYSIRYSGFVGEDAEVYAYTSVYRMRHVSEWSQNAEFDVEALELYHPYYEIFGDAVITPYDAGTYTTRRVETTGSAKNYNILVNYEEELGVIQYPTLEITPRPVDVARGDAVIKVYDSNTRIPAGAITAANYVFIPCYDQNGIEIPDSGLLEGDTLGIRFDNTLSRFERKDVYDGTGKQSSIPIRIYGYELTNGNNYYLELSNKQTDEDGDYFLLVGQITPATAELHFLDESGDAIISRYEVEYDAESHGITVVISGVIQDNSIAETVDYTILYECEVTNYHKTEAPKNAQNYKVNVTVVGSNYVADRYTLELVIKKAKVEVVFGGDNVQTYGSVRGGLTATAVGIDYRSDLVVRYYDENNEEITSITTANAGQYIARAVHNESVNFLYGVAEETFTISRRVMYPDVNVYPTYAYTGKEVAIDVSFSFNGVKYTPGLRFAKVENGTYVPYNYGENALSDKYPINVGSYSVTPTDDLLNFTMANTGWTDFEITPVDLTVSIKDLTLTVESTDYGAVYRQAGVEYYTISPEFTLSGAVNGEGLNKVFSTLPKVRYTDSGSTILSGLPVYAGTYVMTPYDGVCNNYDVTYGFGILTLNQPTISQTVSPDSDVIEVSVEGSFTAGVTLIARVVTDVQYDRVITAYEVFRTENEEYKDYNVVTVYNLSLSDGNVRQTDGGMMIVKLYVQQFADEEQVASAAEEEEEKYYVARLSADGTVTILDAIREGNYLVFETDTLETFAVLTTSSVSSGSSGTNLGWLLYVGIAVGVILIGVAILIVKKRAS